MVVGEYSLHILDYVAEMVKECVISYKIVLLVEYYLTLAVFLELTAAQIVKN